MTPRQRARAYVLPAALVGTLVVGAAAPSLAQDVHAIWLKKPSQSDLMGVWPAAVSKTGEGGSARLGCTVTVQGAVRACRVLSETPEGSGFGQAGLALTPQFVFKPATKDGQPVEEQITIPIKWPAMDMRDSRSRAATLTPLGDDPIRVISNVAWSQAPSVAEVLAAYPAKARAAKVEGRATLDCTFGASGSLHGCEVLREEPRGEGFGPAARKLSTRFVGPALDGSGKALSGAHVQLPFVFTPPTSEGAPTAIGTPQWTALPKAQDLVDAFPKDALKAGVAKGRVVMGCTVGSAGQLDACVVRSEDPANYGLGKATVGLAGTFKLSLWSAEGLPTIGGSVDVPIRFDLSDTAAPKP